MTDPFESIAIIGMGARLPGAEDIDAFWRLLREGRESVSFPSDEELHAHGVTREELADPAYVRAIPYAPGADMFDADFFEMTPRDAEICDPQLRLFLEVAHSTVEHAGYDVSAIGAGMGVFGATGPARYADMYVMRSARYTREPINLWTLNNVDYLATLTSYKLGLHGPSYTMATACSSSLVAVHLACQSLRLGECDLALAGGSTVNLPYGHGHFWAPGGVKSPDGHCRPFDAAGGGTVFGNGTAAVLLKRLADAVADGDQIHAVIRGTAINNDGGDKVSFSAPSVLGQSRAVMEAMGMAGVSPHDISYVEAHGTGTALGDPVEVTALTNAYRLLGDDLPPAGSIALGSVKSNIGHLVWAAGVASLIKVALAMGNEQLPASINFTTPNPRLELEGTPFFVNDAPRPWPHEPDVPRRAGVSSLGIGGTNAHVVVEAAAPALPPARSRPRVVLWSGRVHGAVDAVRGKLADYFAEHGETTFANAVATLQHGRTAHPLRQAVVCDTAAEAAEALSAEASFIDGASWPETKNPRECVFLFPGQGAQHPRMAVDLYGEQPCFTEAVDLCLDGFEQEGIPLYDLWLGADQDKIRQNRVAQPLLFSIEYALARTWVSWGIRPAAVLGHSVGELVAATIAGVFTWQEAVRLVAARANAMEAMPEGAMLAVALAEPDIRELLPDGVTVAAVNSAAQTVVAGSDAAIAGFAERLRADGISTTPLPTSHAFHSPAMAGAVPVFEAAFDGVRPQPPDVPLYSGATGQLLTNAEAMDPRFWARQLAEPVLYGSAFEALRTDHDGPLLEIGPGQTLSRLARRDPAVRARVVSAMPAAHTPGGEDERTVLNALARLWTAGVDVDWTAFNAAEKLQRVPVPGYQYQRRRYWVDPLTGPAAPRGADGELRSDIAAAAGTTATAADTPAGKQAAGAPEPARAEKKERPASPYSVLSWTERPRPATAVRRGDAGLALTLLPADTAAALPLVGALQQAGHRVIRVRTGNKFGGDGDDYRVRPVPEDMRLLAEALEGAGRTPAVVVHAWGAEHWSHLTSSSVDDHARLAFHAPLALLQRFGRGPGGVPDVMVLATRSVDVSGCEPVDPAKALTHGLVHSLALETPELSCRIIDVGPEVPEDDLIEEIALPSHGGLVALRGRRRWIRTELPFEPSGDHAALRREGVYLLTGGLGGLGLALAAGLAGTGLRPRLALLGRRTALDERSRALIENMEQFGAKVKVIAGDVADQRALTRALDVTTAAFGPVNGVFHLAGVAGDGMLQFRSAGQAEQVLRPKLKGTLLLEETLAQRPPVDFVVAFSSTAALDGMVGSGDYAAANAFMDGWATAPRRSVAGRRLSINWPRWASVGMAAGNEPARPEDEDKTGTGRDAEHAASEDDPAGTAVFETELSAQHTWALDEHRFGGRAVLPGTGHLDIVVRAFRESVGGAADAPGFPVILEEVTFERPLIGDSARDVRVVFTPDGEGGERHAFTVTSRPSGSRGERLRHVSGHIGVHTGPPPDPVDPAELRDGLAEANPPSFAPMPGQFLTLGPRWQGLERMWAADGTRLLYIRLPEPWRDDLPTHPLHPAILDLATALVRDQDRDPSHLPFLYERLVLHHDVREEVFSLIRRRPDTAGVIVGDIEVVAADGTVLAEITGFTMRLLQDRSFAEERTEPTPRTSGSEAPAPAVGLDPETGVRLLLTLLERRTPAQVTVRPYRDGAPKPIAAEPDIDPAPGPGSGVPETGPALPAMNGETSGPTFAPTSSAPQGPRPPTGDSVQARLLDMWQEAIGRADIKPDDDFFDIGGDSLSAVQLMTRIRDEYGIKLSTGILFEHPTLEELTGLVRRRLEGGS